MKLSEGLDPADVAGEVFVVILDSAGLIPAPSKTQIIIKKQGAGRRRGR